MILIIIGIIIKILIGIILRIIENLIILTETIQAMISKIMIIDILVLNIIMKMDMIGKDSTMIIILWIKEKENIKEILLILFRAINILIDRKEVGAEVEVGVGTIVDIGEIW